MPPFIRPLRVAVLLTVLLSLLVLPGLLAAPTSIPTASDFEEAVIQGYGDRQNSITWSMMWWRGDLYVGTNRAVRCARAYVIDLEIPGSYPPNDPDVECTPSPYDLPLAAQIWRYSPQSDQWTRLYTSPMDLPIPGLPFKVTAREQGFRYMMPYVESDGTEALYVAGVSTRFMYPDVPPPRILRSVDGINFEAVPQAPGTYMGDTDATCFRSMTEYRGRFYVVACDIWGSGTLLEAINPEGGNDNFYEITPEGWEVFSVQPYNGWLYVGLRDDDVGYSIYRTQAQGSPPYTFLPVVTNGGCRVQGCNIEVSGGIISMDVLDNRLYAGTGSTAHGSAGEMIRVNPDNSWDLIVGPPRVTLSGYKTPLSGMGLGFDNEFNLLLWRMGTHDGTLYVGTYDQTTDFKEVPGVGDQLRHLMGFDLAATEDGEFISLVTTTGFDDMFSYGARTFMSTPHGLYVGTANDYYGTRVWNLDSGPRSVFVPMLIRGFGASPAAAEIAADLLVTPPGPEVEAPTPLLSALEAPTRVLGEPVGEDVLLYWEPVRGALGYDLYRSDFVWNEAVEKWIPGESHLVGHAATPRFVDPGAARRAGFAHYLVRAVGAEGTLSPPSNVARVPSLRPVETVASVNRTIGEWAGGTLLADGAGAPLAGVAALLRAGEPEAALQALEPARLAAMVPAWRATDLDHLTYRLAQRVAAARDGLLATEDVIGD